MVLRGSILSTCQSFYALLSHSNRRIFIIKFQNAVTLTTAVYELLMLLPKDEHAQYTPALCYTGEIVAAAAAAAATAAQFS